MQIVWKLWNSTWHSGRRPRILYLADRNVLVDQPLEREYRPAFGSGEGSPIWKLRGEAKRGREIYFGLYQQLAYSGADLDGMFRDFDSDFFDLVIVDECHRGSARATSSWRAILDHFASATQLGMTATPKRDETADSYDYFGGGPIFEYSLAQGIDDGFLAPYRVRRVVLSADAHGWAPDQGQLDLFGKEIPEGLYTTPDFERVVSLLTRTEAAAKHLTEYLRRTDRWPRPSYSASTRSTPTRCDERSTTPTRISQGNTRTTSCASSATSKRSAEATQPLRRYRHGRPRRSPPRPRCCRLASTSLLCATSSSSVPWGRWRLFKQMIGRGTRLFPDEDKLSFDIIDYSGATGTTPPRPLCSATRSSTVHRSESTARRSTTRGTSSTTQSWRNPSRPSTKGSPRMAMSKSTRTTSTRDRSRKFYVDDAEVWVTAEATYHLDARDESAASRRVPRFRDRDCSIVVSGPERATFEMGEPYRAARRSGSSRTAWHRSRGGGEAGGHADVVQRPGVVVETEQQHPTPLPSLCQRNPAIAQSAVRSCLTFDHRNPRWAQFPNRHRDETRYVGAKFVGDRRWRRVSTGEEATR